MSRLWAFLLLGGLAACDDDTSTTFLTCRPEISFVDEVVERGQIVRADSELFTTAYDTVVMVGGYRATVIDVDRDSCELCDECVDEYDCEECEWCDYCVSYCTDCMPRLSFRLPPSLPYGVHEVVITHAYGESEPAMLTVVCQDTADTAVDTADTADTGEPVCDDTGTDTAVDTGDTAADTGDTAADTGDTAQDSGDTGSDTGDTAAIDTASDTGLDTADTGFAAFAQCLPG